MNDFESFLGGASRRDSFNMDVNNALGFLSGEKVKAIVSLFVLSYAVLGAPFLPGAVVKHFDTFWFRLVFCALIVYMARQDPKLAIVVSVTFCILLNLINKKGPFENFEGPQTAIYPGCLNITVYDLLESFNNDRESLLNAMLVSKVPGDVTVTDYYAPLIATYLLAQGFVLKAPCRPPGQ